VESSGTRIEQWEEVFHIGEVAFSPEGDFIAFIKASSPEFVG